VGSNGKPPEERAAAEIAAGIASERAAVIIDEIYPKTEFDPERAQNFFAQNNAHFTFIGRNSNALVDSIWDYNHTEFHGVTEETNYRILATHPQTKKLLERLFGNDIDFDTIERDINLDLSRSVLCIQYLEELGYRFYTSESGEAMLELPDLASLLSRWKELQVKYRDFLKLPNLKIISGDGLSDFEFAKAYLGENDATLSSGKGFCQDHFGLVMPRLLLMLKNEDAYQKIKEQSPLALQLIREAIQVAIETGGPDIKDHQDQLYGLLAMLTDTQFNHEIACVQKAMSLPYYDSVMKTIWTDPKWRPELERRFPGRSFKAMPLVWRRVCEIFAKFKREELRNKKVDTVEDAEEFLKTYTWAYAWERVMLTPKSLFVVPGFKDQLKKAHSLLKTNIDPTAHPPPKFEVEPLPVKKQS
jgi:hypothetical protein